MNHGLLLQLLLLLGTTLNAQIKCELNLKNELVIIGSKNRCTVDLGEFFKKNGPLYFHIAARSSNRFTVFVWKLRGSRTDIEDTALYHGDSLAFDFVDAPDYGVYTETQNGVSFYGRESHTEQGVVFVIDWIRGLPKFPSPIALQPLLTVPNQSDSK